MNSLYTSEKDGLFRQEILRHSHHKVAHMQGTEKSFAKYCESASKMAKFYFTGQEVKARQKKQQEICEEKQFQFAVSNGKSEDPVEIIYIEDIESGKVLLYDPGPLVESKPITNIKGQEKTRPILNVSTQSVQISEFFPEGYQLQSHREVRIDLALSRIKFRAKRLAKCSRVFPREVLKCSGVTQQTFSSSSSTSSSSSSSSESLSFCSNSSYDSSNESFSYSSSSDDDEVVVYDPKLSKDIYNLSTKIGDTIIQMCFLDLKTRNKVEDNEEWFYSKVCEIIESEKFKSAPRFKKIQTCKDYIKWVSNHTNYKPEPLNEVIVNHPSVVEDVPDESMQRLLYPSISNIVDFHRAVAFVKKAKIFTREDLKNNKAIFGGSRTSCWCKRKLYPFQDSCYTTTNVRGEKIVTGLEQRKVKISIPTISLLPHLHPDLKLIFKKN